jgi:hypothetical protein
LKSLKIYTAFLFLLTLLFSGCLSFLSWLLEPEESVYDKFRDNPVYRDKLLGTWARDTLESGNYTTLEFKSDGTGTVIWYTDNKVNRTTAIRYKVSDFQIAFYFASSNSASRANYVITDNNTLSLVDWSDGNPNGTFHKRNSVQNEIESALRKATETLISTLQKEAIIAIISVSSGDNEVSEFIAGELEYILVNKSFIVVDRSQLDRLRQEQNFQLSGDVDDSSAVQIGKFAGANIVLMGSISGSGNMRRLRLRALNTQTARVVGSASEALPDTTVSQQTAPTTPSGSASYRIGDRGPAGGIVFYDKGAFSDGWRYLEAAPVETQFSAMWITVPLEYWLDLGEEIGDGKRNTELLIRSAANSRNPASETAAIRCSRLNHNGFTDWFLPSIEELNLMYINLKQKNLGNFSNIWYWSSSQGYKGNHRAWYVRFNDGQQGYGDVDNALTVRAIRAF